MLRTHIKNSLAEKSVHRQSFALRRSASFRLVTWRNVVIGNEESFPFSLCLNWFLVSGPWLGTLVFCFFLPSKFGGESGIRADLIRPYIGSKYLKRPPHLNNYQKQEFGVGSININQSGGLRGTALSMAVEVTQNSHNGERRED